MYKNVQYDLFNLFESTRFLSKSTFDKFISFFFLKFSDIFHFEVKWNIYRFYYLRTCRYHQCKWVVLWYFRVYDYLTLMVLVVKDNPTVLDIRYLEVEFNIDILVGILTSCFLIVLVQSNWLDKSIESHYRWHDMTRSNCFVKLLKNVNSILYI